MCEALGSPRSGLRAVVALAALLASESVAAQEGTQGIVAVRVLETRSGAALSDVMLQFAGLRVTLRTDSSGTVHFRNVPPGPRALAGRRLGYTRGSAVVSVDGADTTHVVLFMRAVSARLPAVEVTEKATPIALREFERRRRAGNGRYITEDQIDAAFGSDLNTLLASRLGLGADNVAWNRRGPFGRCRLTAYLDGLHLLGDSVADIDPQRLAGVEYYALGFIPVQYPTKSGCGVILFWSK